MMQQSNSMQDFDYANVRTYSVAELNYGRNLNYPNTSGDAASKAREFIQDFASELAAEHITDYHILHPITHSHLLDTPVSTTFVPPSNQLNFMTMPVSEYYHNMKCQLVASEEDSKYGYQYGPVPGFHPYLDCSNSGQIEVAVQLVQPLSNLPGSFNGDIGMVDGQNLAIYNLDTGSSGFMDRISSKDQEEDQNPRPGVFPSLTPENVSPFLVSKQELEITTEVQHQYEDELNQSSGEQIKDMVTLLESQQLPWKIPNEEDRIKCFICHRIFTGRCYLTQHINAKHVGLKSLRCRCGKYYSDNTKFVKHMKKHDMVEKPFKCNLCPNSYHHKTDLRNHSYIHSGRKPHACPLCQKQFARKDQRDKHVNTHKKKLSKKNLKSSS